MQKVPNRKPARRPLYFLALILFMGSILGGCKPGDPYAGRLARALFRTKVTCPEKIWTGFSDAQKNPIVFLNQSEQRAFILKFEDSEVISEINYQDLPIGVRKSTGTLGEFKLNGRRATYYDPSFDREFDEPESSSPFKKLVSLASLSHEFFHLDYQHHVWAGSLRELAFSQVREFPIDWRRQYLSYRLMTELKRYFKTGRGLEAAAYWRLQYQKIMSAEELAVVRRLDRKEGTATYAQILTTLISFEPEGCQISEQKIFEKIALHLDELFDPEVHLVTPFATDSYKIASLAGLILRRDQGRSWEELLWDNEISPIDILLNKVPVEIQQDDPALIEKAQSIVAELNQSHQAQVETFVNLASKNDEVFIKIPHRVSRVAGWAFSDIHVKPVSSPEINIILSSMRFSHYFTEVDYVKYDILDIGLNFANDPCYLRSNPKFEEQGFVLLLPPSVWKGPGQNLFFDDGNIQINLNPNLFTSTKDDEGRVWICL